MKKSNNIKMYLCCISLVVIFLTMTFFSYNTSMRNNVSNDLSKINSNVENISTTEEPTDKKLDLPSFSPDVDLEYYREYYNNKDVIARLEIPNVFNLIITRTSDNEYYLNHSINKESDIKGTEFMDFRVTPNSKLINIYGHNSLVYDLPFKKLENYLDESFYNNNKYILLQHDSGRRIYQIFSFKRVTTDYEHMNVTADGDDFVNHLNILKDNAIYTTDVTFDKNSNIIVLQTCTNDNDNSYYILCAIEI